MLPKTPFFVGTPPPFLVPRLRLVTLLRFASHAGRCASVAPLARRFALGRSAPVGLRSAVGAVPPDRSVVPLVRVGAGLAAGTVR